MASQAQFDRFNELRKEWGTYVSGPWFSESRQNVPYAVLDGEFCASELRQVARLLDEMEEQGDKG